MVQKNYYDRTEEVLKLKLQKIFYHVQGEDSDYFSWGATWLKVLLKEQSDCVEGER